MKKALCSMLASAAFILSALVVNAAEPPRRILCTTFPIHQLTRNVVEGRSGVKVELLLPATLGCPHDYALTPQDMTKLAHADALVVNGLGMEEFLGAPMKRANAKLTIIDSSAGISDTLRYTADCQCHDADEKPYDSHAHVHSGSNPHLFASPRQAARIATHIATELAKLDPEGANVYRQNAATYAKRLNTLADEFSAATPRLTNNRIVQPHGIMDYLARDMGLEIVAVTQPHGQEPAAAEMRRLVETIRSKKAGVIFSEPQYSSKIPLVLAKETGIRTANFDPVASGPENAALEYYETTMRANLRLLEAALGSK